MKKFWLVLLSLGLVMAFSASALAVDVKFSGEFYAGGMYLDKTSLAKDVGPSTAFYFQRLRLTSEFVVTPGVSLITRADIMKRAWGAARTTPGTALDGYTGALYYSAGTTAENENIAFDYAYVRFATPIGLFMAGYMNDNAWGVAPFGDTTNADPCILWMLPSGPVTVLAKYCKMVDNSVTAKNPSPGVGADKDNDTYVAAGIYAWKDGQAGLLYKYYNYAYQKNSGIDPNAIAFHLLSPYVIAQLGPVKVQAELYYFWGKTLNVNPGAGNIGEVDLSNQLSAYVDATAKFGPVYFGGVAAYMSGDDPNTKDKLEGGTATGGADWMPCLIMFNYDRQYWAGSLAGQGTANMTGLMGPGTVAPGTFPGAWFFQGKVGVTPTDKLDIKVSAAYAFADQKPAGYASDKYGWEFDITGTYKITNNLSYMLGFGYFMTGDFFKGATVGTSIRDDYIVLNKLTLTF